MHISYLSNFKLPKLMRVVNSTVSYIAATKINI